MVQTSELIDAKSLSKLKWRCRRGLLGKKFFHRKVFQTFWVQLGCQTVTWAQRFDGTQ
jgi:succinate dehydrogenase flavin-adding protein (antitoxin of CptAB toxin-antitoxin module)